MALIMGDVHGRVDRVEKFLLHRPEEEHIFLGDICDSFYASPKEMIECLRIISLSDARVVIGNHDIHYADIQPFRCSGFSKELDVS